MQLRTGALGISLLTACNTVEVGPGPGEDGMYAEDDIGGDGDGVLMQCGNLEGLNYFWEVHVSGALKVTEMPVICVGSIDTPGFDYQAAVATDEKYEFPMWEADIQMQCTAACEAAHQAGTDETPMCLAENFAPNWAVGPWEPADGANCDSSIPPDVHVPEIVVETRGVP